MEWFRDIFTGIDNSTVDVARVLWIVGVFAFLGFTGYQVYKSENFDMANFSLAYSALLASGAAGVKIKASTEPQAR